MAPHSPLLKDGELSQPAREAVEQARQPHQRARHLPGDVYTSPELFTEEKRRIFMRDWLPVARVEEIENPGDYQTYDIMGDPIIVARAADGALNAFSNICAHRGVEVASGAGNTEHFRCPYHGWTYDLEGKLVGASFMDKNEAFDRKNCRLRPLRLDTWGGFVFINFDDRAESLSDATAHFDRDFGFLRMQDLRLGDRLEVELPCNWKLVVENIIDIYHMKVVHAKTNGRFITEESVSFELKEHGGYVFNYDSGPSTVTGEPMFGYIPWLKDRPKKFSISGYLRPNLTLFGRIDDVHPFVSWPVGPDRTKVIVYTLFPPEFFDDPEFDEKVGAYRTQMINTLQEDNDIIRSLQRAMTTERFQPGYMASLEKGVHHVINYYVERMFES